MTDPLPSGSGPLPLVGGPVPRAEPRAGSSRIAAAAVAARVLETFPSAGGRLLVFLASSERRADEVARALGAMTTGEGPEVLVFPPWDCLPYDRAPPSRESMGRRMAVLSALGTPCPTGRIIVTSPDAVMQRLPPVSTSDLRFAITQGDRLDRAALEEFARSAGFCADERIDEPGEIAILGEVVDVYPPGAETPVRLVIGEDDGVTEIRTFDPVTQRSRETVASILLTPASEVIAASGPIEPGEVADPHRLPEIYGQPLDGLLDRLPDALMVCDQDVGQRIDRVQSQIDEAYETRLSLPERDGTRPLAPDRLYVSRDALAPRLDAAAELALAGIAPPPALALERSPGAALKRYLTAQRSAGRRVILAGLAHEQRILSRLLKRNGIDAPVPVARWSDIEALPPGSLGSLEADLDAGFEDEAAQCVVLTPTDITGGRLARDTRSTERPFGQTELRLGDVIIHEDHGLGVLRALEEIEADGMRRDVLRLEYHGGAMVLAPVEEFGRIWRYGSEPEAVTLDRLNTQGWMRRRAELSTQIDETAARMVEMARVRDATQAAAIVPPRAAYARFAAGFAFPESPDQLAAIDATLHDLASGRPMNRLVCGDVGFGKTEVALRAAAAVALSGRQVMVAAPTTVLARQHYETFRKRFEGTGVEVGHLSRLVEDAEAEAVRSGLADGRIGVVIGTHGLADDGLAFSDLGLVIIDEEHRFGAQLKADLAARADHLLAMSATPIPRTLQSALVGVQDVSIIASPPARRRPIRTFLTDYDEAAVRTLLMREAGRGGQSFVVVPRIEDLEPLAVQLEALVPELQTVRAHGKLAADRMDAVMTGFARGQGDILLSTNIIETGLDVPRANTILIWRADRFGLAQLHQLRGRVGRGRRQGFAYLMGDPEADMAEATRARLQTLEALDRLGAGFEISARDLDLRGGGDLVGEEQAGHIRLIGAGLYQSVLGRALRAARGETDPAALRPRLSVSIGGRLPADYIPDETVRINLYARLAQLETAEQIDAFQEEVEDRFGPLPAPATDLFTESRLLALAASAGVREMKSGPKATAFSFETARASALAGELAQADERRWAKDRLIVEANDDQPHDAGFLEDILSELAAA